jgi:hypothetical protein
MSLFLRDIIALCFSIALREVCSFCGSLKNVSVAEVTRLLCTYQKKKNSNVFLQHFEVDTLSMHRWWLPQGFKIICLILE